MNRNRLLGMVIAVGLVVTTIAGCSDDAPSQDEAEAATCEALVSVRTAAEDVAALTVDSTGDEVTAAREGLDEAVDELRAAAADVDAADTAALEAGADEVATAVDDLSGSETVGAAGAALAAAGEGLRVAADEIRDGLSCS